VVSFKGVRSNAALRGVPEVTEKPDGVSGAVTKGFSIGAYFFRESIALSRVLLVYKPERDPQGSLRFYLEIGKHSNIFY